jgi:hypothetical protein
MEQQQQQTPPSRPAPHSEAARCRSCQAPVLFVASATTGKLMILDAEPTPDGRLVIEDGKARVLKNADLFGPPPAGNRYTDHHVTCPEAAQWRRKK